MDIANNADKYYFSEDSIKVMKLIYDNKGISFADLVNKSGLSIKDLTTVLYGLSSLKYIVCLPSDKKNLYYFTRLGVANYSILSDVTHVFKMFEEFPKFGYDLDDVTEFLREKLYREYRYGEEINFSTLLEEYKGFANKLEMH